MTVQGETFPSPPPLRVTRAVTSRHEDVRRTYRERLPAVILTVLGLCALAVLGVSVVPKKPTQPKARSVPAPWVANRVLTDDVDVEPAQAEPEGARLRGRVLDERQQPVVDAVVSAAHGEADPQRALTDGEGTFAMSVRPGQLAVLVEAASFVPWTSAVTVESHGTHLEIVLSATGSISGRVITDMADKSRLQVVVRIPDDSDEVADGFCDAGGNFEVKDLRPGEYLLSVAVHHAGVVPERPIHILPGERAVVVLEVPALGTLLGSAHLPLRPGARSTGRPTLELHGHSGIAIHTKVDLDDGGRFEVQGIPGGTYEARLEVPGLPRIAGRWIDVRPPAVATVDFAWSNTWIGGRIRNPLGATAGTVIVRRLEDDELSSIPQYSLKTEADGKFTVRGLPPGEYVIAAGTSSGETSRRVQVQEGEPAADLDLSIGDGQTLMVEVTRSGKPASRVQVYAVRLPLGESARFALTGVDGIATLDPISPGRYSIVARLQPRDEEAPLEQAATEISIEESTPPPRIQLRLQ